MSILKKTGKFLGKHISMFPAVMIGMSEGGIRLLAGQDKKTVDEIIIKRMDKIVELGEDLGENALPSLGIGLLGGAIHDKMKDNNKKS